jgi:hypothetical protein
MIEEVKDVEEAEAEGHQSRIPEKLILQSQ